MILVEISNWKDLKEQFGLDDNDLKGCKGAKNIHRDLKLQALNKADDVIACDCTLEGEAICIFKLESIVDNVITYEYTGTAN